MSEFCSMLKVCLGRSVDKKIIYRVMSSLDTDGDKNITLEEIQLFIFYVWRAQLKELANRVYLDTTLDDKALRNMVKEKDDIKSAIIRNFPRHWRDEAVKMKIESPFTNLFTKDVGSLTGGTRTMGSIAMSSPYSSSPSPMGASGGFGKSAASTATAGGTHSSPNRHHHHKNQQANNSSSLKILAMKKKNDAVPYREGKRLGNVPSLNIDEEPKFISRAGINKALNADVTM